VVSVELLAEAGFGTGNTSLPFLLDFWSWSKKKALTVKDEAK
jgi:hypothetical protein